MLLGRGATFSVLVTSFLAPGSFLLPYSWRCTVQVCMGECTAYTRRQYIRYPDPCQPARIRPQNDPRFGVLFVPGQLYTDHCAMASRDATWGSQWSQHSPESRSLLHVVPRSEGFAKQKSSRPPLNPRCTGRWLRTLRSCSRAAAPTGQ